MKEEVHKSEWRQESARLKPLRAKALHEIETSQEVRLNSIDEELNRVLGGGNSTRVVGADRRRTGHW